MQTADERDLEEHLSLDELFFYERTNMLIDAWMPKADEWSWVIDCVHIVAAPQ